MKAKFRKFKRSFWIAIYSAMASLASAAVLTITAEPAGFIIERNVELVPDKAGFVLTHTVALPPFEGGAYYRPFSGGVARGNRVEAVAFSSLAELQDYRPSATRKGHDSVQEGQFILLKINRNKYLALLPMVSSAVYSQFFLEDGNLLIKAGNFGTESVTGDIPLLIWASGSSPYAATEAVWKQAIASGYVATDWRSKKVYPEMYDYLGWCSWEFYKTKISEQIISDAVHMLEASSVPFRWIIVDDGYLTEEGRRIISFTPDKQKFPNGWAAITSLRKPDQIKWMGVWRNTLGYMAGISKQHTMEDLTKYLIPTANGGALLPDGSAESATAFFDRMILDSKDSGFDFTKVDFQTRAFDLYAGLGNAVRAMRANNEALEEACRKHNIPLLNCIAQPNINSLQTKYSALTRSSPDYNQTDKDKNKCNTYQSFANHLWMGQTVWGDLDMFHTHDERDARPMAIARAISGGPVYISDEPGKIVPGVLIPFAYADGKLLRTKAPATLLPESFFIHPFRDPQVFRVIAPLEDKVAAIALFNFTEGGRSLTGALSPADYPFAGELLQPNGGPWMLPEEGLLVYDRETREIIELQDGLEVEVANFDARLFLLYPKTKGWAIIGRTDKYLPAAAVKISSVSANQIEFTLQESGPLAVWSESGEPRMEGGSFRKIGTHFYLADLPVQNGAREISLTR